MEKREAKIVENPKSAMFIRGHNTSAVINEVLTDLVKWTSQKQFWKEKRRRLTMNDSSVVLS